MGEVKAGGSGGTEYFFYAGGHIGGPEEHPPADIPGSNERTPSQDIEDKIKEEMRRQREQIQKDIERILNEPHDA
jgi:hypothetical protein